jgi:hypothetical protein
LDILGTFTSFSFLIVLFWNRNVFLITIPHCFGGLQLGSTLTLDKSHLEYHRIWFRWDSGL